MINLERVIKNNEVLTQNTLKLFNAKKQAKAQSKRQIKTGSTFRFI
jgi:hypothetical protein